MNQYDKSLELLEKYLRETPKEEIQARLDKLFPREPLIRRIIYRIINNWTDWMFTGFVILGLIAIGFGLGILFTILIF